MTLTEDSLSPLLVIMVIAAAGLYGINLFPVPAYLSFTFWHYLHALCLLIFVGWLANLVKRKP